MAALDAALALAQVQRVAVAVGQQLDLDVARPLQVLLDVHGPVARTPPRASLPAASRAALDLVLRRGDAHPLAAAAPRRLERTGSRCRPPRRRASAHVHQRSLVPGTTGTPASSSEQGRARLGAHGRRPPLARRPDEDDPRPRTAWMNGGVLAEEAVAGVDGLGAPALLATSMKARPREVALGRGGGGPIRYASSAPPGRAAPGGRPRSRRRRLTPGSCAAPDDAEGDLRPGWRPALSRT